MTQFNGLEVVYFKFLRKFHSARPIDAVGPNELSGIQIIRETKDYNCIFGYDIAFLEEF